LSTGNTRIPASGEDFGTYDVAADNRFKPMSPRVAAALASAAAAADARRVVAAKEYDI